MQDSFVFYRSFYESVKELPDDAQLTFLKAVIEYALDETERNLPVIPNALFTAVKPQIDANAKRRAVGSLGGRPKKTEGFEEKNHRFSEEKTEGYEKKKPNVNVNVNVNENENVNENANVNVNAKEKKMFSDENIKEAVDTWNSVFSDSDVPKVTIVKNGSKREKMLHARIDEFGIEKIKDAIALASASKFLTASSWFSFDWFICPNNFVKVAEGNYQDHAAPAAATKNSAAEDLDDFYRRAVAWAEGE